MEKRPPMSIVKVGRDRRIQGWPARGAGLRRLAVGRPAMATQTLQQHIHLVYVEPASGIAPRDGGCGVVRNVLDAAAPDAHRVVVGLRAGIVAGDLTRCRHLTSSPRSMSRSSTLYTVPWEMLGRPSRTAEKMVSGDGWESVEASIP